MRNIKDLHPKLQEKLAEFKSLCEKQGLTVGIGECLRTASEQDALYAKGRTKPGNIVTNAKGSTYSSMHQWGVAFDFYRNDGKGAYNTEGRFFEKVGEIGKSLGLIWGGDWTSPDMPHFQLSDWGNTASVLKKRYKTPDEFFETWEEDAMTAEEKKEFEDLKNEVAKIKANAEKVYHYTAELPDWARGTIQRLLDKGIYAGAADDDLNLPESLMRTLVINDRAGVYGE